VVPGGTTEQPEAIRVANDLAGEDVTRSS
jgi:hypothetical protein